MNRESAKCSLDLKASPMVDDSLCYRCSSGNIQNSAYNFSTPAELQESKVGKLLIRKHVLSSSKIQTIHVDLELLGVQLAGNSQRGSKYFMFDQQTDTRQHIV